MYTIAARVLLVVWPLLLWAGSASSDEGAPARSVRSEGLLEVECNIAHIDLLLCPKSNFVKRELKVFFGLISSHKYICSGGELPLGSTPLKPVSVPAGEYILLIPPHYVWEHEGPIEVSVSPGEKTYFLLKLFSTRSHRPEEDHGGGGGGGAAAVGP